MHEFLIYTISGLATGGIYAITAGGLTLTYTTTGIFNFAHGATGMLAAFTYWQLHYDWGWPVLLSLAVVLLVLAPLFGAALHLLIMRRLDGTSDTTKLMVTVALLLSLMAAALWIWDPKINRTIRPFWAGHVVTVWDIRIPYHNLITIAVAALAAVALWILLTRTRVGVAMRATVDDRSLAVLNGSRPETPGMLAWAIGTMLAAIAGILVAPALSLSPLPLTLLIVNAYAAAVIGRLKSLPWTFGGALILGLANDYAFGYLPKWESAADYTRGFIEIIPVVVLFIALLMLPNARLRGHSATRSREIAARPSWLGGISFGVVVILGAIVAAYTMSRGDLFSSTKMWGLAIVGLSCIPLVGYAGKLSLCQLGFAGIGAITVSHLGSDGNILALVWAALICAAVGALIALPALRLSGIYLALATAAFAVALDRWIFAMPKFTWFGVDIDLFNSGNLNFERFDLPVGSIQSDRAYFIFGAIMFVLVATFVIGIRRSELGRRLLAMKDSQAACATIGMNHKLTTLAVFALSAAIAGIGGAVYGGGLQTAAPVQFEFVTGLSVIMLMVIAGLTSPGAALFAGIFLGTPLIVTIFPEGWTQITTILIGLNGIALGKNPNGFIPSQIRPAWEPALRMPVALGVTLAAEAALAVAALTDVISGWTLLTGAVVVLVLLAAYVRYVEEKAGASSPEQLPEGLKTVPEAIGLGGAPIDRADVEALDRILGLPASANGRAPVTATAGGRHGS